jgi:hypothetical protein
MLSCYDEGNEAVDVDDVLQPEELLGPLLSGKF